MGYQSFNPIKSTEVLIQTSCPRQVRSFFIGLAPSANLCHQVGVDPPDHPRIHIGDLERVVRAGITGSTTTMDHLSHPLVGEAQPSAKGDAVTAIAREAGFSISADDLTKAQSEISEEELEAAAGGWIRRSDTRCFGRSITGDGCLGPTQEVGCKK